MDYKISIHSPWIPQTSTNFHISFHHYGGLMVWMDKILTNLKFKSLNSEKIYFALFHRMFQFFYRLIAFIGVGQRKLLKVLKCNTLSVSTASAVCQDLHFMHLTVCINVQLYPHLSTHGLPGILIPYKIINQNPLMWSVVYFRK